MTFYEKLARLAECLMPIANIEFKELKAEQRAVYLFGSYFLRIEGLSLND